jgi:hypothetical protein
MIGDNIRIHAKINVVDQINIYIYFNMTNFGNKFNSSIKRLGVKIERGTKKLGHKITNEMGRNQPAIRKVDNTLREVSKVAQFIPGGQGAMVASLGAHMANTVAKKSRRNRIEKYNSRKANEERASKNESLKPGFF